MLRILFVDDDAVFRRSVTRILTRLGHAVYPFASPTEALDALSAVINEIDLVVTDFSMAGMDGFRLASEVHAVRKDLPIAVVSGHPDLHARPIETRGPVYTMDKPISVQRWRFLLTIASPVESHNN